MSSYIFQINEVRERPGIRESVDANGYWMPSYIRGDNQLAGIGATGTWWICDGHQIRALPENTSTNHMQPYKTYSMFYCPGLGFRVMLGDATNPSNGEAYRPLGFDHDGDDGWSSYLTNVLMEPTLRCQRQDQVWTRMLLPNNYHGALTTEPTFGGLKGELPIFLALIAFSMPPEYLTAYLPSMMQHGLWQQYPMQNGWIPKRGVVVTVYTFPGGSSAADLQRAEEGPGQRYYA